MMPYFLKHYSTFADKIVVFDEQSNDGTQQIVKLFPKAELRKWPHRGLDDRRFIEAVNGWYKEARGKSDWVMWPDVDEILWHPDPLKMLSECKADVVQATGYGMVSREFNSAAGQIYDTYRMGVRQSNYDKAIIWRPGIDMQHTHGRHTYENKWPKHNGVQIQSDFKLLHYHYFGVEYTARRNARNFMRAIDKRFAWNYAAKANADPKQNGSVAWVKDALESNRLIEVVPPIAPAGMTSEPLNKLKKVQLGSGGLNIPGFENYDVEVDLRKQLPFPNDSCSHIVLSHCIEHITHQEAWNFFEECRRVLMTSGRVRVGIPDFNRLWTKITPAYCAKVKEDGHGDGSDKAAMRAIVFEHGHKSVWNRDLLSAMLEVIGFDIRFCEYGKSEDAVLCGVDLHGLTVGQDIAKVETSCVEGVKP